MMTSDEFHDAVEVARQALLPGGSANAYLLEDQADELRYAHGEALELTDSDEILGLMPEIARRPGSDFYSMRRISAYVWYGQLDAAVLEESLGERAQRFAVDLDKWPGSHLPNELIDLYNRFIDDARESETENPFIAGDVRATPSPSGLTGTPGVYARATLEACAEVFALET